MKYNKFDMRVIARELGAHFDKYDSDSYTGTCSNCGVDIAQNVNLCECGMPVIWYRSQMWSDKFGDPKLAENKLRGVKPTTLSGRLLLKRAGVNVFYSASEEQSWAKAERELGTTTMDSIIRYVFDSKHNLGRGGIRHAVSIAANKLAKHKELTRKPPIEEVDKPSTVTW